MSDSPRTALPMATSGCSCCSPADDATAPTEQESADPAGTTAGAVTYPVEGMTCGHCVGTVTQAVSALDGVEEVRVELVAGGASPVIVTGPASADAVRAAIDKAGYRVLTS